MGCIYQFFDNFDNCSPLKRDRLLI